MDDNSEKERKRNLKVGNGGNRVGGGEEYYY